MEHQITQMQLFETIKIENGIAHNLPYHNARLNKSRKELFGKQDTIEIEDLLENIPPLGLYKAKVIYDTDITHISYTIYRAKKIEHLYLIESAISYPYKYLSRDTLDTLLLPYKSSEEIIIVQEGLLTDTTIANIALRKNNIWYTPINPLLPGTTRSRLLDEGKIHCRDIPESEIIQYDGLALMNAMIGFYEIDITSIKGFPCP